MSWSMPRKIFVGVVLAVVVVVVAVQGIAGTGNPGQGTVLDVYSQGTSLFSTLTQPPQPGQQNIGGSDLFVLGGTKEAPAPTGERMGRRWGVCTVSTPHEVICEGIVLLDGRGTLTVQLGVLIPEGNQGIAVTGGTGEFAGTHGTIVESKVPGHPDDRILHIDLKGLKP